MKALKAIKTGQHWGWGGGVRNWYKPCGVDLELVVNYYTLNLYYSTTYYVVQGAVHISHPKIFFKKLAAYLLSIEPMCYSSMWYYYI